MTTIKPINVSVTSHSYLFLCVRPIKIYSVRFQKHSALSLALVTHSALHTAILSLLYLYSYFLKNELPSTFLFSFIVRYHFFNLYV